MLFPWLLNPSTPRAAVAAIILSVCFLPFGARAQQKDPVDPNFRVSPALTASPSRIAIDPTGRVIAAGGDFLQIVNGHPQRGIARFLADGRLDHSFDCGTGFDAGGEIADVHIQTDGKILITGTFSSFGGAARQNILRLLENGTVDPSYAAATTAVSLSAIDSQNRLYVFDGVRISRLTASGASDPDFPSYTADNTVLAMVIDSSDRLLFVEEKHVTQPIGIKNYMTTSASARICRLNETGDLDLAKTLWSEGGMIDHVKHVARVGLAAGSNNAFYLSVFVRYQGYGSEVGLYGPIEKWDTDGEIDLDFSTDLNGEFVFDPATEKLYVLNAVRASQEISAPRVFDDPLRILPDGRIDPTFNSVGLSFVSPNLYIMSRINDAALFPDGTLAVVGTATHTTAEGAETLSLVKYILEPVSPTKPTITGLAPVVYAVSGTAVRIDASVVGTPTLQYNWRRGDRTISSESYLSLDSVTADDAGNYIFTATNEQGSASSSVELVIVPQTPTVITQPQPAIIQDGPVILEAFVTGLSPLTYQWFKDGAPLTGPQGPMLILPPAPSSVGEYVLVAANERGMASTDTVRVDQPTIRLAALAARCRAGTGDQTLIMGLVLQGPPGKQMLLRGVGPGISGAVPTALPDPYLKLFEHANSTASLHAANDNWSNSPEMRHTFARLGASALETGSRDAALLSSMQGGIYTAHVEASNGGSGIALAEIYDADLSHPTRLKALATRAVAGAGHDTLIAGFVLDGIGEKRILVRGLGPALVKSGVSETNVLKNPTLTLYKMTNGTSALIGKNDGWDGDADLAEAFSLVGASALDPGSRDAALIVPLGAGVYTAHVTSADSSTGVALIEIFELP